MGMLDGIGAFASGFGPAFSGAMQNSERMALQEKELAMRQAAEKRAAAQQEFMLRKYMEAQELEAKKEQRTRDAAGALVQSGLGISPTTYAPLSDSDAEAAGDFMPKVANPEYEAMRNLDPRDVLGLIQRKSDQRRADETERKNREHERWKWAQLNKGQGGASAGVGKTAQERITDLIVEVDMARAEGRPVDAKKAAMADMYRDNPTFNPGGALTRGARGSLQKAQDEAEELKKNMGLAAAMHKDEFSTTGGALSANYENFMGRTFGVQASQNTNDMNTWKALTEQNFQTYRKWATGVAASEKELRWLLEGFPNSQDGPDQYRAKMKAVEAKIDGTLKQKAQALGASRSDPVTPPRVRVYNPQTRRLE